MKLFNKYKFSDKSQALGGILSTIGAIASIASFGYGVYLAFKSHGNAGIEAGSFGMLSFMLAVIGMIIGLLSFKEDNRFYTLSKVGSLLCGVMAIFMVLVFLMGIV